MYEITSFIGDVSRTPFIIEPIPCTSSASVAATVPAPSHTITAASINPNLMQALIISELPKITTFSLMNFLLGEQKPK